MDAAASEPRNTAVEVFADWLAERAGPQAVGFDALVQEHPQWADELRELHETWRRLAEASEPSVAAEDGRDGDPLADSMREHPPGRYRIDGEVARGGMGAILRVWDADLRRHLAMKVALAGGGAPMASSAPRSEATRLQRFLEEARVTSQLDHPGIVPVHELGLDPEGRHYFTMKLVEGRDLKQIFELVFTGHQGWSETRALGVIEKVCEAMAYAHQKGIIHRDLKPANIMVGSFGEVYVMDWGLSRVLRREDLHDLRLAAADAPPASAGGPATGGTEASPLLTMDGVVLGTPSYMPPEQARGDIDQLTPRSDVYSIGAMLYHLLARRVPYGEPGTRTSPRDVLDRVRAGPPPPLLQCNAAVPAELVAICERAMARDPMQRYADTLAFAEDLRAYLEHRVVAAYEAGAIAELRKWIGRNRALAGAVLSAIVILVVAAVVSSSLYVMAKEETVRADAKADEAEGQRRLAAQRADDVLSLSAAKDLQELVARADALWPASPANIGAYEQWLRDAHTLLDGRPADVAHGLPARRGLADHREKFAELAARALPPSAEAPSTVRFANVDDSWWYSQLGTLIADLEALADPQTGLCSAGTGPEHGWGVQRRLEEARTIAERSVTGPAAVARWQEAIASIADPERCPKYRGLRITAQLGLLPLGRDAASGLWEFAHLPSGGPAAPGPDGAIVMHEGAGIVFVLVPGGSFWMGAQTQDPAGRNYDPEAFANEAPVHEVALDPFFVSKFEVTQDQWERFTGRNPSLYGPASIFAGERTTLLHPVEQVSGRMADTVLQRLDLQLPTEAQWERAARADTTTIWWTGPKKESLEGAANLADAFAKSHGGPSLWPYETWLDDGRIVHAPVGSYRANGFGLHDVCGNVYELCREAFGAYGLPERAGDGERQGNVAQGNIIRGGGYHNRARQVRSAFRTDVSPTYFDYAMGVRPVRRLEP
ncbi:MAG: bifunctional serine/threonine-protein kinase/formylglycine-generating enzyme family protein [Planctomycetota bacterium]